ncbi:hypothetical protein OTU49_005725, partial [Cherax quadricarinatus]
GARPLLTLTLQGVGVTVTVPPASNQHFSSRLLVRMTAALPGLFTRPYLVFNNQFGVPIFTDNDEDGVPTIRNIPLGIVSFVIILDALAREYKYGRTFTDDQMSIYRSLEARLDNSYGQDGRFCLLRFICEVQKYPIEEWTIVGQLINAVFTPGEDEREEMVEYREARLTGRLEEPESCIFAYGHRCPFSIFNYFSELDVLMAQGDLDLERQGDLDLEREGDQDGYM